MISQSTNQGIQYVLALDVGTTLIKSIIFSDKAKIVGNSSRAQLINHPRPGWSEIEPEKLWVDVKSVILESIHNAGLSSNEIACLGISSLRNTFITWDSETGEPFHSFITWQDMRSEQLVNSWNNSSLMKIVNITGKLCHAITRNKKTKTMSLLKFSNSVVTMKLMWVLSNVPRIKNKLLENKVRFGTIDTWLLWKLTEGKVFATDYSMASCTGLFDPNDFKWSSILLKVLGIPMSILPKILDSSTVFGYCAMSHFGTSIPICAILGDVQASVFGLGCYNPGDICCVSGTGNFLAMNTGSHTHGDIAETFPTVGWKIKDEVIFLMEGFSCESGKNIDWTKSVGWLDNVGESTQLATSVAHSNGILFIPKFHGVLMPFNCGKPGACMIGLTHDACPEHIVRSILESIAFHSKLIYDKFTSESNSIPLKCMISGGVSNNSLLVEFIANLFGIPIYKPAFTEMSSFGVALMAGLACGIWKNKSEVQCLQTWNVTLPSDSTPDLLSTYQDWLKVVCSK